MLIFAVANVSRTILPKDARTNANVAPGRNLSIRVSSIVKRRTIMTTFFVESSAITRISSRILVPTNANAPIKKWDLFQSPAKRRIARMKVFASIAAQLIQAPNVRTDANVAPSLKSELRIIKTSFSLSRFLLAVAINPLFSRCHHSFSNCKPPLKPFET